MVDVHVLERHTLPSALGVVLWDDATRRPVSEGLSVSIVGGRSAVANRSGVFVFHRLPAAEVRLEVRDRLGRFHRMSFSASAAGEPGPFTLACGDAEPGGAGHVPLYSTAARPVPAGMTAVRASLYHGELPAPWAVLEVTPPGGPTLHGIADERGEVAVLLPWPAFRRDAKPPAIAAQTWPLKLKARYQPADHDEPAPRDVCTVLGQPPAKRLAYAKAAAALTEAKLTYGAELVLGKLDITPGT
jgi:hypothetical protein